MAERDPHKEPENSTVEDWHGQEVDRMKEDADRAMEETGGDETDAESRFEKEKKR